MIVISESLAVLEADNKIQLRNPAPIVLQMDMPHNDYLEIRPLQKHFFHDFSLN